MARRQRRQLADYTPRQLAGLKGFWVCCNRHYGGDARRMVNTLIWRGLNACDPCPGNRAWARCSDRLPTHWRPPPIHPEIEPPF